MGDRVLVGVDGGSMIAGTDVGSGDGCNVAEPDPIGFKGCCGAPPTVVGSAAIVIIVGGGTVTGPDVVGCPPDAVGDRVLVDAAGDEELLAEIASDDAFPANKL